MLEKIISVFIMILLLYMSVSSVTQFSTIDNDKLSILLREFNFGFIEDIQIKEIPATCDINYSPVDFDFNYPGNYKGCQCVNQQNRTKIEGNYGDCPVGRSQCVFFKERNLQRIIYWRTKLICIKRSPLRLRDFLLINETTITCDEGYKNCGKIDTLGNQLCLLKTSKCPISNLRVSSNVSEGSLF
jgi:hypothetical protein